MLATLAPDGNGREASPARATHASPTEDGQSSGSGQAAMTTVHGEEEGEEGEEEVLPGTFSSKQV